MKWGNRSEESEKTKMDRQQMKKEESEFVTDVCAIDNHESRS